MSVEDLDRVHRRYITLSNAFKAAWTFHQFLEGLRKVFTDHGVEEYPADFQTVYNELKEVSQNLNEAEIEETSAQLDGVEEHLEPLAAALLASDEQVAPRLLRRFFQRVKNYDDNILAQLVKFYLYSRNGEAEWSRDRLDKADFLTTKLAVEQVSDGRDERQLRDHASLRELADGLWAALGTPALPEGEIAVLETAIAELRAEIQAADSMDDLYGGELVARYRSLKHSLGDAYFQPRLLPAVLATNLALKNQVHELYRREEQRIVAEYQHVFELQREVPVDVQLGEDLERFREAVERFEEQLQGDGIRLDELAGLRSKVRDLLPRLQPASEDRDDDPVVVPRELRETPAVTPTWVGDEDDEIRSHYDAIVAALDDTNPTVDPKKVALSPEIFSLGVSPREIVAYRRLFGEATCDRQLEEFVLRAAALRGRLEDDVQEIKGILDDTAITRDAPVFSRARRTCRLADLFVRRFEHLIEHAVLTGDSRESSALLVLKMRLIRVHAGLWLMLYRS